MSFSRYFATPGLGHNPSMWAIPAAWFIGMCPTYWSISVLGKNYKNAYPKETWGKLDSYGLTPDTTLKIEKAQAAQNNSNANLPLFAAAMVAGNLAGLDSGLLNASAATYLALRTAYNFVYIYVEDETYSYIRTLCYWGGLGACFNLFIKAGNKLTISAARF